MNPGAAAAADTADAKAEARAELWRRFDAGALGAAELDARLQRVDGATGAAAATVAVDGPVAVGRRLPRRLLALAGVAVLAVLAGTAGAALLAGGGGNGGGTGHAGAAGAAAPPVLVDPVPVAPPGGIVQAVPPVAPDRPDCEAVVELRERAAAAGGAVEQQPTSEALLSDPPFLPDGYRLGDDFDVIPGADGDIAMSTTAGFPLPIEIRGRELEGERPVRMRSFRYAGFGDALAAGREGPRTALCDFGGRVVASAGEPAIFTVVVADAPIPPTAFAGFHRGDRRFSVAVEAASGSDADLDDAATLAAQIAAAELAVTGAGGEGGGGATTAGGGAAGAGTEG